MRDYFLRKLRTVLRDRCRCARAAHQPASRPSKQPVSGNLHVLPVSLLWLSMLLGHQAWPQEQPSRERQTRLKLDITGILDASCDTSRHDVEPGLLYYVGGMYDIQLRVLPHGQALGDVEYAGVTDWTWPAGLTISVAQAASDSDAFHPSAALYARLGPSYYVPEFQARLDSVWRAIGQLPHRWSRAPEYHFAIQMPPELAGSYLCIRVEWQHPRYGYLSTGSPCVRIIEPCSPTAQHTVWSSQIKAALDHGDVAVALARADSFVTWGWRDVLGLVMAMDAAQRQERYDEAIRFLDLCWETNHTVNSLQVPNPDLPPSDADRRIYESHRARLVELKNQQQR